MDNELGNGVAQPQETPPANPDFEEGDGSQQVDPVQTEITALREENRQTQEFLRSLASENQLLQQMVMERNQEQPPADQYSEEDGLFDQNEVRAMERMIADKVNPVVDHISRQAFEAQETAMRNAYPDYDAVTDYAQKMMKENPTIAQIIKSSHNPAMEAYRYGKTHPDLQNQNSDRQAQLPAGQQTPQTTLGNVGGGVPVPTHNSDAEKVKAESPEKFQARLNALRNS